MRVSRADFQAVYRWMRDNMSEIDSFRYSDEAELFFGGPSALSGNAVWVRFGEEETPITNYSLHTVVIGEDNDLDISCDGCKVISPHFNKPLQIAGSYANKERSVYDIWALGKETLKHGYLSSEVMKKILC